MKSLHFKDIQGAIQGNLLLIGEPHTITHLLTDSRRMVVDPGSVFFAIGGPRHDGHQFIDEVYQSGIRQFVVEKGNAKDFRHLKGASVVKVNNTIRALQQIAAHHRQQFSIPVIAITGSNGKTIIKEWLSQLLSEKLNVAKSPNSYNSQIGVPLSVWELNQWHQIGIFETGISQPGEMHALQQIIRPSIGIFSNIGSAHDEGFSSQLQKVQEKSQLFSSCDTIIYCKDYRQIEEVLNDLYTNKNLVSWSSNMDATFRVSSAKLNKNLTQLSFEHGSEQYAFKVPFTDEANIENCIHCIVYLLTQNWEKQQIQDGIIKLKGVSMRLELKEGINDCYLIDDTYNNDFTGLRIALEFLAQQKLNKKKTVILSDILQTGLEEKQLYKQVGAILADKGIDRLLGVGPALYRNQSCISLEKQIYPDFDQFLEAFENLSFHKETILVKGARTFQFERIVKKLLKKVHGTVLEINLDALTNNLNFYRSKLAPGTKMMVMVKAFAYGSGSHQIAQLLQYHRVDYLGVAYTDEGVELRQHGIYLPIMVMNPTPEVFETLIEYQLEPEIYSLALLRQFDHHLILRKKSVSIHLKLDTGMHRLGLLEKDLSQVIKILKQNKNIKIASVFSHLAGADKQSLNDFSHQQATLFNKMVKYLEVNAKVRPIKHLLNSPGISRFPQYHYQMVRLGIGLYGVDTTGQKQHQLQPIGKLKTTISQIKSVKKGQTVGYGRKGKASKDLQIAVIGIGYADGFDRGFSNGVGKVKINGRIAPIIGNVCMDMSMVDITGIEAVEGDEVIIFGTEPSIDQLASAIHTIPYEILTKVSERVKRVYYTE
ncbi:MAG: bifunctional UDP-N-acetylmuramoyl-tripeptide:D-alanyl-D-alanine ligase/alanine racemase [Bacteroidetes bacterium]|nr:bifunctional UDP-N-acetylmuramoyl-tripeptide:D-alanyl-D-alanine ligase/alanine racemase [Bacteroidota bacterium]